MAGLFSLTRSLPVGTDLGPIRDVRPGLSFVSLCKADFRILRVHL